jgi:hypothetical protein
MFLAHDGLSANAGILIVTPHEHDDCN